MSYLPIYYPTYRLRIDNDFIACEGDSSEFICHDKADDIKRQANIDFHIQANDYFGSLATMLQLILEEKKKIENKHNKILGRIKNDLMSLQKNYTIKKQ